MDLSSMIKRENFFEIFFPTVKRYFKEVYEEDIHLSFALINNTRANLFIYPHLSAAVVKKMSKNARSFFYSEWNVRDSWLKHVLAKLYIFGMTHSSGVLAQYKFRFEPERLLSKDLVIAPNNRSIRIFDYNSGIVGCIAKQGFTKKYFINQLNFRTRHDYPFIPKIIDYGEDWFSESIMHGHPLARVTDNTQYNKSIYESLFYVRTIAHDTVSYHSCVDYVSRLTADICEKIDEAKNKKKISTSSRIKKLVQKIDSSLSTCSIDIPVVLGHGDLQTGNIWVDTSGKTWIYDWETVGSRSIWYDTVTLLLSTRRAGGIEKLWEGGHDVFHAIIANDGKKDYSIMEIRYIIDIVLLEDLLFYLDDMLELPLDYGRQIFDLFAERLLALDI